MRRRLADRRESLLWLACVLTLALAGSARADAERDAQLAELRPPKRARPLVAVLANNGGTETTDFVVPLGVLRASGIADVLAVAMRPGPIELMPALRVRADLDAAAFDRTHPQGADYVIVPALHDWDDPVVSAWLAAQARAGAVVIGICEGAWVLGAAGLLDGRRATTHWFSVTGLRDRYGVTWAENRRYVADRGVATTTGVTASIPLSLTLVEAVAGRARAEELAREFGAPSFGAEHDSARFALGRGSVWTLASNWLAFWSHESLEVPIAAGVDEVALALTSDAWARTYRSSVHAVAAGGEVTSRRGLTFLVDPPTEGAVAIALPADGAPALDGASRKSSGATGEPRPTSWRSSWNTRRADPLRSARLPSPWAAPATHGSA